VLCTKCCQFLWIVHSSLPLSFVCLRHVSCVPNVASFSGLSILDCPSVLFVFILCLVYQMLPVSLDCPFFIAPQFCLSSSCVLCTQCCQFLWIVHSWLPLSFDCLRPVSCVPNVASFSGLSILDFPLVFLVFILCLVYQMLPVSLDYPSLIAPSVLFVFILCLMYQMLPVSMDCPFFIAPQFRLSSSCVLCTQCCQFLWIVILHCPSVLFVFVLCLVYQMLSVSLDCPFLIAPQFCLSSSYVLCTKCCQFLWIVHSSLPLSFVCLHPVSCVPNVASFSGLSILDCPSVLIVFVLCLVYQMLPVSLDCPFLISP
jgi:hypothetical protein